jgi:tRNA-specific 2-thiouridylase
MRLPDQLLKGVQEAMELRPAPGQTRVVVAMSGGVDSSVVAGLLKSAGYEVIGITLQLYDHGEALRQKGACCAGQDIHDARRVAANLNIPHYVLDYESRFRSAVIDTFAESYIRGETPIPCVSCNHSVKFVDLLQMSRELGADALATGHYVAGRARTDGSGHRDLLTPVDLARDQSYFLYSTTQAQVDFLRFPLGGLRKSETRALAELFELTVAEKPDSQDICFVPKGRYQDVIARLRPEAMERGEIVHVDGRVLGEHDGIVNFTVGQRRGLGVHDGEPLYVVHINPATRQVFVGARSSLLQKRIALKTVNWLGDEPLRGAGGQKLYVKIRSTRPPVAASLSVESGETAVILEEPEEAVSPGQACVFYERPGSGARVLGGGTIAREEVLCGKTGGWRRNAAIQLEKDCSVAFER